MVTSEERLKILKMIQDGRITAEEGIQLLEVLSSSVPKDTPPQAAAVTTGKDPRWFRVKVTDTNTGKTRVNIRLPISVIKAGTKLGARFSTEVEGLDMGQLMGYIQSGEIGKVVDVYDDQDGEHVEVFLE